jgi:hypothetical protein
MTDAAPFPWVKLTSIVGGLAVLTVVVRGVTGVVRIALDEARYRVEDPDTWVKWARSSRGQAPSQVKLVPSA